jgi:NAD(P)-dependent dehydrogenase (short-subunit alcohol dehydrogenase family)
MGELVTMKLDLASLDSVRQFVKEFHAKYDHLDILVNNAGVMIPPEQKRKTKEGYEIHMGTNHLGHFLLTNLLLDSLKKGELKRIVTLSSDTHSWKPFDLKDIFSEKEHIPPTPIGPSTLYIRSKMANALFNKELGKKLEGTGINTYGLCPGVVQSDLAQYATGHYKILLSVLVPLLGPFLLKTLEEGASTTMYCALNKDLSSKSGEMYQHCGYWDPKDRAALTDADAKSLWEQSVKLVGL